MTQPTARGLLRRASLRHLLRHPGQLGLSVLGVALGVAVVVSIDLAIQSAKQGFRVSAETVAGRATHQVSGGSLGLPDSLFAVLRRDVGIREAAPVVEGFGTSPNVPGLALRIVGVDPFSEGPFRPFLNDGSGQFTGAGGAPAVGPLITTPLGVVMAASTARDAGVGLGEALPLVVDGRTFALRVVGLLGVSEPAPTESRVQSDSPSGAGGPTPREESPDGGPPRDLLLMDIASAQTILGRIGVVDRIDLRLPEGPSELTVLNEVAAVLPGDARVEPAGTRTALLGDMIGAFDLNLRALSLLALIFGMFLIYNAQTFSVVQRRELLGSLRSLGVTRGEVLKGVLRESVWIGAAGATLGVILGVLLGRGLVRLVTRTISDLYFVVSVDSLSIPPEALIKGAVMGVGATVLASLAPAFEAASAPPRVAQTRSTIEARSREAAPRAALAGGVLMLLGAVLLLIPTASVLVGFGALFFMVLGMALMTPQGTIVLVRVLRPGVAKVSGILGTMAARGVVTSLSRTAPAIAALVVAVSVTVGLGIMIQSFRGTLIRWLDTTLQADVYVTVPALQAGRMGGAFPPEVASAFRAHPEVAGSSTYRGIEILHEDGLLRLVALDLDPRGERSFDFVEGNADDAFPRFRHEQGVLVSEPFAFRNGVGVGDTVTLATPEGEQPFRVAGVFYDYGSEQGVVMMSRATYSIYFDDPAFNSLGLFLVEGSDANAVARELEGLVPVGQAVSIQTNRLIRARSLEIFDRTFQITAVLRLLAFIVAFVGILSSLMALELERSRELGVLRANGMTPRQVWQLVTTQTGLTGLVSGILAIPVGLVLAVVMIYVVNKRSFGWTLQMDVGPDVIGQAVALAVVGALIAGLYPAWRMSRTSPAEALRGDA